MLWNDKDARELFSNIKKVKRESRMAREKSEDAVTWNIFRYLEMGGLIESFLSSIAQEKIKSSELIYWSYNQKENGAWTLLNKARQEFGEEIKRGSEPDIIVKTDKAIFFIEAKLFAGNNIVPSDSANSKKYETGGSGWFSEVFESNYQTIAIEEKKYELLRFWLLGTWISKQLGLNFYFVNLVLRDREIDIENIFGKHIKKLSWCKFIRTTWENIYQFVLENGSQGPGRGTIIDYCKNKTMGYDQKGEIQKAFSI
jgi:hypothetical protein